MIRLLRLTTVLSLFCLPSVAQAIFLELEPSGDQWIRSTSGTTAFTSDAISVRDSSISGDARWGILQFDLSGTGYTGAELLSASLDLNARSSVTDAGQNSLFINITSGTQAIDSITWDQYQIEHAGGETTLGTLGYVAPATALTGGQVVTTPADASDLALLASTIDGSNGSLLTFVFAPNSSDSNNDWTDGPGQLDNAPSILRLEFPGVLPPCGTCNVELTNAAWIRDGSAHPNDGVLITNNDLVGGFPTVGLMEWDLSEITDDPSKLVSAELTFTVAEGSRTMQPGQVAGSIDTTSGTSLTGLVSRQAYETEYAGTEVSLEGLGVVPNTTGPLASGDTITTVATAADLELLRGVLNGSDLLTLAMLGSDAAAPDGVTGQYWGDGVFGAAPQLTLTFIPEPSSLLLLGLALFVALARVRRNRLAASV